MMTEARSATIVERCANENGLNMAVNIMNGTFGKQRSVNRDDRRMKAPWYFCFPAFPCGSFSLKSQLVAF
jgi:hypothetical protein